MDTILAPKTAKRFDHPALGMIQVWNGERDQNLTFYSLGVWSEREGRLLTKDEVDPHLKSIYAVKEDGFLGDEIEHDNVPEGLVSFHPGDGSYEIVDRTELRKRVQEARNTQVIEHGAILVQSGKLAALDPCHGIGSHCGASLQVKRGSYRVIEVKSTLGSWGTRTAALILVHESVREMPVLDDTDQSVGVDAGVAGFCDEVCGGDAYCAALETMGFDRSVYELDYGVMSSSGLGDGYYTVFAGKNEDGEIVAVMLDYLDFSYPVEKIREIVASGGY